jgi:hypothetical protein
MDANPKTTQSVHFSRPVNSESRNRINGKIKNVQPVTAETTPYVYVNPSAAESEAHSCWSASEMKASAPS